MEVVTHHALREQKENPRQEDYKQKHSESEPGRVWSFSTRRIRIGCHPRCLSTSVAPAWDRRSYDPAFPALTSGGAELGRRAVFHLAQRWSICCVEQMFRNLIAEPRGDASRGGVDLFVVFRQADLTG